jgi:hypothetical protein
MHIQTQHTSNIHSLRYDGVDYLYFEPTKLLFYVWGEGVIMLILISSYMIPMKCENELIGVHIGPSQKVVDGM